VTQHVLADPGEVLEVAHDHLPLGGDLARRLAVVPRLDPREGVAVGVDQLRHPPQHARTIGTARPPPAALECPPRGGHGAVDVLRPGFRDPRPDRPGGRVAAVKRVTVGRGHPFAADVQRQLADLAAGSERLDERAASHPGRSDEPAHAPAFVEVPAIEPIRIVSPGAAEVAARRALPRGPPRRPPFVL
jgi:hypothetical protein